jgi:hypothetical protein
MTDPRTNELVHQVFFGWTYTQPTGKLDLRAWSLEERDAKRWSARLKEHIRLQGTDKPPHALSYIAFDDGTVAILRRVLLGHSGGRNNSHALIGSADVLTVTVALALDNWTDWQNDPPQHYWMPSFTASHFADITDDGLAAQMLPLTPQCEQAAGTVLTRLLDKPHAPLSIIGCPAEQRLPLVWALRGAADTHLRRNGTTRRWSFSTHEARHEDAIQRLPEIVFLPAQPEGTGAASRTIVDLTSGREPVGGNSSMATTLVTQFLHKTTQREPVYEQPLPREVYVPTQPPVVLPNARTVEEFLGALGKLETSVSGHQQRRELRATLDVDTMNKITTFVESTTRKELTRRVLTLVYGHQLADLQQNDGLAHAAGLIAKCDSEYVARKLSAAALSSGKNQVTAAAYHRWVTLERPPVITPPPRTNHERRTTKKSAARAVVTRMATALFLVFIIGFLLGLLIGRPTQPAASGTPAPETTTTTTASTAPQPGTGPSSAGLPTVGRVAIQPNGNERVYSFVQAGDKFYPQAPCHNIAQGVYQCVRIGTPTDPQPPVELVAIIVPENQVAGLQELATRQQPTGMREGWRDTKIVPRA